MSRLERLAALAAATRDGADGGLRAAAAELLRRDGAAALRETLRQLHLYCGFPKVLRALNVLAPLLPAGAGEEPPVPADPAAGRRLFAELYGEDAALVLPHLEKLDPVLAAWILDHAYGRVLPRPGLPLGERERLAVLLLAADGCWKQWESHVRICRRLGIGRAELAGDLTAGGLLAGERLQEARARLEALA